MTTSLEHLLKHYMPLVITAALLIMVQTLFRRGREGMDAGPHRPLIAWRQKELEVSGRLLIWDKCSKLLDVRASITSMVRLLQYTAKLPLGVF